MEDILKYLNTVKQIENNYTGIESYEDDVVFEDAYEDANMPYNVNDIRVEQKMITVFQVEYWISDGKLNLQPDYQRNLVWDLRRRSALIESILLRIPIPAFYLDESKDGTKNVIDGLQRLSTIDDFLNDRFVLKKLQYLSSCEGMKFSQLDNKYKSYILDTVLSVNILGVQCPDMVKFDVFRRVNTGGLPLNSQEIRNIMATLPVRTLLKEMSSCDEFINATLGGINDVRMAAQELCLRYITIGMGYDWEKHEFNEYYGLTKTMDRMILVLNDCTDNELQTVLIDFKKIMIQAATILKSVSFCKFGQKRINAALFTSWAVVLHYKNMSESYVENISDHIFEKYKTVMSEDGELFKIVTSSTGSKKNILSAIDIIRNLFEEN